MAQVGIELYYQLIERAVKQLKGENPPPEVDPEIRFEIPAYIPEDYIPDIHQRLKVYKRLSGGLKNGEIPEVERELQDRFGVLPLPVENLLLVASLKPILRGCLVTSLGYNGKEIVFAFHPEAETSLEKILALVQIRGDEVRFTPGFQLHVSFPDSKDWKAVIAEVKKILQ
jgi:transcription-repair coupling factor (superfamily II helicase)